MDIKDKESFFREMTLKICGNLDIKIALQESFLYAETTIPVDAMALCHFNPKSKTIHIQAKTCHNSHNLLWEGESSEIVLPPELAEGDWADVLADAITNRPNDGIPQPWLEVFPRLYSHSAMFVSLGMIDQVVGVLVISVEGLNRYNQDYIDLIKSLRQPFGIALSNARRYQELLKIKEHLIEDNQALSADIKRSTGQVVIGADKGLYNVMTQVQQIAQSNSSALLLGETGTGKEIIANAIHMSSPRAQGPMISIQCGAVPDTLLDSELFGHEKGAFTGANERKRGRFERADGGSLFLDEVGELSPEAQVKLLRVLQEQSFERVGGTKTVKVSVRVIAATHRDLRDMVQKGQFREDLWYRLNVLPIHIPPLRLRRNDIPDLVNYFVQRKIQEMNLSFTPSIKEKEIEQLKAYNWPGNVRELQNIVERALILSQGDSLTFPDLKSNTQTMTPLNDKAQIANIQSENIKTLDEAMADHIKRVLNHTHGRVSGPNGAAELLDMNPSTLRWRIKKLEL